MKKDRWWTKDRDPVRVLLLLVVTGVAGVVLAVVVSTARHDHRMAHQPVEALERVHVPGSVRHTSITSTGCGGYTSPRASRTDWSTLPATEIWGRTAALVRAAGWSTAQEPADGFSLDGMTLTISASPTAGGGSRVTTSISAPDACYSDQ